MMLTTDIALKVDHELIADEDIAALRGKILTSGPSISELASTGGGLASATPPGSSALLGAPGLKAARSGSSSPVRLSAGSLPSWLSTG